MSSGPSGAGAGVFNNYVTPGDGAAPLGAAKTPSDPPRPRPAPLRPLRLVRVVQLGQRLPGLDRVVESCSHSDHVPQAHGGHGRPRLELLRHRVHAHHGGSQRLLRQDRRPVAAAARPGEDTVRPARHVPRLHGHERPLVRLPLRVQRTGSLRVCPSSSCPSAAASPPTPHSES